MQWCYLFLEGGPIVNKRVFKAVIPFHLISLSQHFLHRRIFDLPDQHNNRFNLLKM